MPQSSTIATVPWYRISMVWLVIGGPAVVVVASLVTCVIAFKMGDPPLAVRGVPAAESGAPAMHARNHAATPRP